jgi:hypothetical protein
VRVAAGRRTRARELRSRLGNPEYLVCVKAKGGHYSDKKCSVAAPEGRGKYELAPVSSAKKKALKGKSGASKFTLYIPETGSVGEVNCEKKTVKVGKRPRLEPPHTT